ncbi:MAG: ABC transporter ATP-binding protein [Deltaproteobacteria bacterium]|nr:ABC transporter ATP-binding protein [Deltaproteobacteria bacterium]
MLNVHHLVKRYHSASRGSFLAVDHLSFQVGPGEVYGLLGPNGAGKTTTLRMLATLTRPDEGTATVEGFDIGKAPLQVREHLAYVPAEAGLPDRLTPREVVRLFAQIQGVQAPREAADALLERLGATRWADGPCGDLSTGMKRRVVLARALVHNPRVLLLDEPTDGLDVQGRREVLALVRELAAEGRAVVLSSHILSEVQRVAARVGIVSRGAMRVEGTIPSLLEQAGTDDLDEAFVRLAGEDAGA